jgi:SPP1 gp7 family putative phage head morphogenesis protein
MTLKWGNMPKTAKAIQANRGIEAWYRKQLRAFVDQLNTSYLYWIKAAYRKQPPAIAQDAAPSDWMRKQLSDLGKRWMDKIDEWAPKIAESYVKKMFSASDSAFRRALKDSGWAVEFEMTPAMQDAFNASLTENIGLIKSIPMQYHDKVTGTVMRSYTMGRDLESLTKELKKIYPSASHRAELIARDQSNKANAVVNRTRQLELGITKAIWMHSHAGKNPRPDHVKANGKEFDVEKGCLISGEYIWPGEKINCRCSSRAVLPI